MATRSLIRPWWSSVQRRTSGSIHRRREDGAISGTALEWFEGHVATPRGFVIVYSQAQNQRLVHMQFIWRGRQHGGRCKGRVFSTRDLAREARRFAEDVVAGRTA